MKEKKTVRIKLTRMQGNIRGHPELGDMNGAITSRILSVKGQCTVETLNTIYILEEFVEKNWNEVSILF